MGYFSPSYTILLLFHYYSFIMGKVTSLYGKTTGKIGSIVFSTSGGETIAREYNPHVANPNTIPQVNQRARMKLMSQLSANLAPVIAMTKEGLKSRRNKFVAKNFDNSYALDGVAQISYENVQLTEGSVGLPQLVGGRTRPDPESDYIYAYSLASRPASNISRVVYIVLEKTDEGKLSLITSEIESTAGTNGTFEHIFANGNSLFYGKEIVVYAYGMADTSEKATARYGNLNVQNGSDLATLIANRSISFEDFQLSQTRGLTTGADGQAVTPTPQGEARVFVTALGNGGTVSGGGSFELGTSVTVVATPASGYEFVRWVYNGTELTASTNATYTFTLNQQVDLVAVFASNEGGGGL